MVAYVQKGALRNWYDSINGWIEVLFEQGDPLWTADDRLRNLKIDTNDRVAACHSEHDRVKAISPTIKLNHLWVDMA